MVMVTGGFGEPKVLGLFLNAESLRWVIFCRDMGFQERVQRSSILLPDKRNSRITSDICHCPILRSVIQAIFRVS